MSARPRQESNKERRAAKARGRRDFRKRSPEPSHAKVVPLEFYPRYSTIVGSNEVQAFIDVSAFRAISIPIGRKLTIRIIQTDDTERGSDELPTMSQKRVSARSGPHRPSVMGRASRRQSSVRRRRTGERTKDGGEE